MSRVYILRCGEIRRLQERYTSNLPRKILYAFADQHQWECYFGSINGFYYPMYNVECNALLKYKIIPLT